MKKRLLIPLFVMLVLPIGLYAQGNTHWQCDIYAYEYDMSIYFNLKQGTKIITDFTDYEVAAFVGGKCRGVAEIQTVKDKQGHNVQYGYIRVYSNKAQGETVSFKVYQASTGKTLYAKETVPFKYLQAIGQPSSPFTLTMSDLLPGDVNGDSNVTPADAIMILYYYFNVNQTLFNVNAADLNGDGVISPADAIEALYLYFGTSSNSRASLPSPKDAQEPE